MEVEVYGIGVLTDEHAQSKCGVPILLVGSRVHGPGDLVHLGRLHAPAWRVVQRWAGWAKPKGEGRELAVAFVSAGRQGAET